MREQTRASVDGIAFAVAAYGMWGVTPVYWKALASLPAPELLAHRVLWSCGVGLIGIALTGSWGELARLVATRRLLLPIALSALLIGGNWLTFIFAVETDRVLETSLGYYINPLVSVALGGLVLGERLRRAQLVAVAIAAAGVAQLVLASGNLPWISLVLAASFAAYGLVRKLAEATPLLGFGVETLLLSPAALVYLLWLTERGEAVFPAPEPAVNWLVAGSGLLTAAPLLCFTSAARRLNLASLGMFQYIAPSIAFGLAVALFGERFTRPHAIAFGCVWAALALYSADALRAARGRAAAAATRAAAAASGRDRPVARESAERRTP